MGVLQDVTVMLPPDAGVHLLDALLAEDAAIDAMERFLDRLAHLAAGEPGLQDIVHPAGGTDQQSGNHPAGDEPDKLSIAGLEQGLAEKGTERPSHQANAAADQHPGE